MNTESVYIFSLTQLTRVLYIVVFTAASSQRTDQQHFKTSPSLW